MKGIIFKGISILILVLFAGCATRPDPELVTLANRTYPPHQPFPNSFFFSYNDANIHYRVWNPDNYAYNNGKKTGILLIHGLGASTFSWRFTAEDLVQQGYTVVAADLPAFGYTSRRPGARWTDGERSTALWALLQQELPDITQWILVGHSYGGRITLRMTVDEPDLAAGWVGVSPAVGEGGRRIALLGLWPFRQIARSIIASRFQNPQGLSSTLENAYGREPSDGEILGYVAPFLIPGAVDGFIDFTLVKNPQARYQDEEVTNTSLDLVSLLEAPGLLIWGQDDQWVSPDQADSIIARKAMPLVVIEDGGHVVQETHPERVREALFSWLNLLPLSDTSQR